VKEDKTNGTVKYTGLEIAVIGMAGRFPGAKDIHEFWENLKNSVETISFFSHRELEESGVDPQSLKDANYVKATGILEGIEYFDSLFFGYSPREADIMDPQMRVFHECAWHALENAGYCPDTYEGLIGLYAGASTNFAWEARAQLSGKANELGQFAAMQLMKKDFLSLRISYTFNLKGPAVLVQSACSTSLVAIHMACQAILNGECDLALAGGAAITSLEKAGYLYREGIIHSPDGHCRTFDAKAKGTVGGNGAGVVVLKRWEEAMNDGDFIYAVVKGSAINNDGVRKIGFTAPSIEGQAEVIMAAQEMAEVEPGSIAYVETHGTGTELGDPVEIEALKLAFKPTAEARPYKKNSCALGSIKSNMGHLDDAAGVTGFIKAVLSIYHRLIPPSLHFEKPNPKIDLENSPFYVNTALTEWKNGKYPRRAGVSSFGIGGTNAHVILEEWPGDEPLSSPGKQHYHLLLLSAKTEPVLKKMTENLAEYLKKDPDINLADAAYTLQKGRKAFKHRQMLVCSTANDAIEIMSSPGSGKRHIHVHSPKNENQTPAVIFMFSGQGAQYVNMGLELYQKEPIFQEEMDRCFEILKPITKVFAGGPGGRYFQKEPPFKGGRAAAPPEANINQTEIAQPLLFVFEYALAKLLMAWGITPYAMIGHSIGEYAAACLSGVFSLEDALKAVVLRGQLMQQMPGGSMPGVPLPESQLLPLLEANKQISLAAVNSSSLCTISGTHAAIDDFEKQLKESGYQVRRLHTSHAFHSSALDPIVKRFEERISQLNLNKPEIPYISNVTGHWQTVSEAVSPAYWAAHVRQTVRFSDGLKELLKKENAVFIEVGPGNTLSTFVRKHADKGPEHFIVNLIRHPREEVAADLFFLTQIGRLWLYDVPIDWQTFHAGEKRLRIPLPPYPFELRRYPVGKTLAELGAKILPGQLLRGRKSDMADWFYVPQWMHSTLAPPSHREKKTGYSPWLVLMDEHGLGEQLVESLEKEEKEKPGLIFVKKSKTFAKSNEREYTLDPGQRSHYEELFRELQAGGNIPAKIIHLWNITGKENPLSLESLEETKDSAFYSLLWLARSIGTLNVAHTFTFSIDVITDNMQEIIGGDGQSPQKAMVLGPVNVIPKEYPNIRCRSIDIQFPEPGRPVEKRDQLVVDQLVRELNAASPDPVIAYRGNFRWRQTVEPVRLEKPRETPLLLKEKGVYLVTGGLGGIGLTLAEHLVKSVAARVILTGRSASAKPGAWQQQKLQELEALGGEVLLFSADAADKAQMQEVISRTLERFGRIDGVIHAAGVADGSMIQQRTRENSDPILAAKVNGTLVLDSLLKGHPLDFFVLCSSLSSFLAPFGQVGYCSANVFLDAFTHYRNHSTGGITLCINWDSWQEVGMAVEAAKQLTKDPRAFLNDGILPAEGVEVFDRIMESRLPRVAVSVEDLPSRWMFEARENARAGTREEEAKQESPVQQRPDLSTGYIEPGDEFELTLAEIFRDFLGIERVGIDDNFFELGLSSLDLMHINGKLKEKLKREIPVVTMFTHSTVRTLAQYIYGAAEHTYAPIEAVETKEYYPLSAAQNRLYILQQIDTKTTVYNLSNVVVLEGELNRGKMERVFLKLVNRHECFQTSYIIVDGEVVQKIHDHVDFGIEYNDLTGSQVEVKVKVESFMRPFDLGKAPLMRVGVIKLEENEHILILSTHHLISDGISQSLFTKEFMALYGDEEELPWLRVQYKDYSQWQNNRKAEEALKLQEDYWLKEFAGEIPVLNLPTDFARPEVQNFEGRLLLFEIDKKESRDLKKIALEQDVSLFVLLLAILNVLISKISGQEDILVGTQIAGRRHVELEHIIGVFLNTLVLRNYPHREKTFRELLKETKEKTLKAFENQDYQFEDLVEKVLGKRQINRNPMFDFMLVWQNFEQNEIEIPGLTLKPYEGEAKSGALIDLTLYGSGEGENLIFMFEYNTSLFKKETIERFTSYFKEIISFVTANKNKEIKLEDIKISYDLGVARADVFRDSDNEFDF